MVVVLAFSSHFFLALMKCFPLCTVASQINCVLVVERFTVQILEPLGKRLASDHYNQARKWYPGKIIVTRKKSIQGRRGHVRLDPADF